MFTESFWGEALNDIDRFMDKFNTGMCNLLDGKCKEFKVKLPNVPKVVKLSNLKPKKIVKEPVGIKEKLKSMMIRDG